MSRSKVDRRGRWALLILVVGVATASCGGSAQENPARAAEAFLHAVGAQDTDASCRMVVDESGKPIDSDSAAFPRCEQYMRLIFGFSSSADLDWAKTATVTKATVDGDTATVPDSAVRPEPPSAWQGDDTVLQRVDGLWYVQLDE